MPKRPKRGNSAPLTRDFKEFAKARIERDPEYAQALLQEAVQTLVDGDVETAKSVLRDYINATIDEKQAKIPGRRRGA
jgi:hypothetical protein